MAAAADADADEADAGGETDFAPSEDLSSTSMSFSSLAATADVPYLLLMLMIDTYSTVSLREKATLYAKESLSHVRVGAVTILGCNGDGDATNGCHKVRPC